MSSPLFVGIDLGTSGCRGIAIDRRKNLIARAQVPLPAPLRSETRLSEQDPWLWWQAVVAVLHALTAYAKAGRMAAIAVDATSSTLLLCDATGKPLTPGLLYDDTRARDEAARVDALAPRDNPARGPSSSLCKLLWLVDRLPRPGGALALHQADWIAGRLSGRFGISDWNNALKLGFDAGRERWPEWLSGLDLKGVQLPRVVAPGTSCGRIEPGVARITGLPAGCRLVTGTTDSTAAILATGAAEPGEAVTVLGSTLVVKLLTERAVFSGADGVYSHRLQGSWLAGGASNSGGAVLHRFFDDARIQALSGQLEPRHPTGLDYYPLARHGERFPVSDPDLEPRLTPRPANDRVFFQGILEGIAHIEAQAYARLHQLGAPPLRRVITIGGGATNEGWRQIRERLLGVSVTRSERTDAAYGTALLARRGYLSRTD